MRKNVFLIATLIIALFLTGCINSVPNRAKYYRVVEIKGRNAQHSRLHNNSQVDKVLIKFLWNK